MKKNIIPLFLFCLFLFIHASRLLSQENHAPELFIWPDTIVELDVPAGIMLEAKDEDTGDTLSFIIFRKPDWSCLQVFPNSFAMLKGIPKNENLLFSSPDTIVIGISDGKDTTVQSIRLHYIPWQPPQIYCGQEYPQFKVEINTEFETAIKVNHTNRIHDFRIRVKEIPEWSQVEYKDSVNIHLTGIPPQTGIYTAIFIATDTHNYSEYEITIKVTDIESGIKQISDYSMKNGKIIIPKNSSVCIYDISGNLVLRTEEKESIDLSSLIPGLYIVSSSVNHTIHVMKIIIHPSFRNL
jgi:hypothetical protein